MTVCFSEPNCNDNSASVNTGGWEQYTTTIPYIPYDPAIANTPTKPEPSLLEPCELYTTTRTDVEPIKDKLERQRSVTPDDGEKADNVNHPAHYTYGTIEVIDYIEDKEFSYNLGNAIKYISRAGHKWDAVEDLEKAVWYINREIGRLKKVKSNA